MRKFLFMAACMMALCVGMSSCGNDEVVEPKREISEWNEYCKSINWNDLTEVSVGIGINAYETESNDFSSLLISYSTWSKNEDGYPISSVLGKTIRKGHVWKEFAYQTCQGRIKIVDTGRKNELGKIYEITAIIYAMQDTDGKWAENVKIHCTAPMGKMLTY